MSDTTRLRKPPPAEAEPASPENLPVHGDIAGASRTPPHDTSRPGLHDGLPDDPAPRRGGDSLFRNAYALMLSTGVSAGLGLGFWLVAARYYTEEAVGQGSAAIAAMRLLASLTATTMIGAVVRYVPRAGRATGPLVWRAYAVSSLVVCLAALAFLLTLDLWGPSYAPLDGVAAGLVFTAACMGWALLTLQDGVLTGLRRAFWVPVGNAVFSVGKLLLLIVFASLMPVLGIFVSWAAAIALSTLPLAWLIFRRLIPRQAAADHDREPPSVRDIGRFLAGDSVGALFSLAMINLLPVMVAVRFDAAHNGFFYIAYTVGGTMEFMAINMASSLTAHASHSPESLASGVRGALRRMTVLLVPVVLVLVVFAPQILAPFGADYAQHGTTVLRLLAAAALPRVLVELYIGVLRVQGRTGVLAALQGTMCFLVLGSAALLMGPAGISGAGLAMLVSMTAMALVSVPGLRAALAGRGPGPSQAARLGRLTGFGRVRTAADGRPGGAGLRPGTEEYGTAWARRAAEYAEEYGDDWARRTAYLRGVHDDTATPAFGIPVYLAPADPWGQGGAGHRRWRGDEPAPAGETSGWGHEHPDGSLPSPAHATACGPEPDGPGGHGGNAADGPAAGWGAESLDDPAAGWDGGPPDGGVPGGCGNRRTGDARPHPARSGPVADGSTEDLGQERPDRIGGGRDPEHLDDLCGGHHADTSAGGRNGEPSTGGASSRSPDRPDSTTARPGTDRTGDPTAAWHDELPGDTAGGWGAEHLDEPAAGWDEPRPGRGGHDTDTPAAGRSGEPSTGGASSRSPERPDSTAARPGADQPGDTMSSWGAEHLDEPAAGWGEPRPGRGGHDADAPAAESSGERSADTSGTCGADRPGDTADGWGAGRLGDPTAAWHDELPGGTAGDWGAEHLHGAADGGGPAAVACPGGGGAAQGLAHGPHGPHGRAYGSRALSGGRGPGPDDRGWGQSPAEHPPEGHRHSPAHRRADGPSDPRAHGHLDGPGDSEGAIAGEDPGEARLATSLWLLLGLAAGLFWTPLLSRPAVGDPALTGARLLDALPPLTVTAGVLLIVVHSAALSLLRPRPGLLAATLGITFAALHGAPAALGRIPEPVNSAWYGPLAEFLAAAAALDGPEALLRWLPTVCQLLALAAVLSILHTAGLPVAAQWGALWLLTVCGWALQQQLAPLALPLQLLLACAAAGLYALRALRTRRTRHTARATR